MNEPVIDQSWETTLQPSKPWWVTSILAFLMLAIINTLIFVFLKALVPMLTDMAEKGAHTAGEAIALVRWMRLVFAFLTMLFVGNWMGRSLAPNMKFSKVRIAVLAFTVGFLSMVVQIYFSMWINSGEHYRSRWSAVLYYVSFHAVLFAAIAVTFVHFQRTGGFRLLHFALLFFLFMATYFLYFYNW